MAKSALKKQVVGFLAAVSKRLAEVEEEKTNIEGELEDAIQANAELAARIAELMKEIAELRENIGGGR